MGAACEPRPAKRSPLRSRSDQPSDLSQPPGKRQDRTAVSLPSNYETVQLKGRDWRTTTASAAPSVPACLVERPCPSSLYWVSNREHDMLPFGKVRSGEHTSE